MREAALRFCFADTMLWCRRKLLVKSAERSTIWRHSNGDETGVGAYLCIAPQRYKPTSPPLRGIVVPPVRIMRVIRPYQYQKRWLWLRRITANAQRHCTAPHIAWRVLSQRRANPHLVSHIFSPWRFTTAALIGPAPLGGCPGPGRRWELLPKRRANKVIPAAWKHISSTSL